MSFRCEVERILPPTSFPVTLAEAKAACRVLHNDEDDYLNGLIAAATDYIDGPSGYLGQCILTQNWRVTYPAAPAGACGLAIPFGPVASIISVKTWDSAVFSADLKGQFDLINKRFNPVLIPVSGQYWPALANVPNALRIEFSAGAAAADGRIKQAILMLVAHWFVNREAVIVGSISKPIEFSIEALLVNLRRYL